MVEALEASSSPAQKILIADDDPSVVEFLASHCTQMGFDVQTANNGLQALLMARRNRPDILIADVNMPEVDGLSLCQRLLDPAKKGIEVIVITGSANPETIERCEGFGAVYGRKGPDLWNVVLAALIEICPGAASEVAQLAAQNKRTEMRARPLVLVVDDDPDVGSFLASRLEKCGVDTLIAPDGIRAYRIAIREKPTVILSDYFMPDGDIHYLLWRLRSTPATEKVPIFVMSGRQMDEKTGGDLMKDICGRPGAVRLFKKPFDLNELLLAIQEYCAFDYASSDVSTLR